MIKKTYLILLLMLVSCKPSYTFLNNATKISLPFKDSLSFSNYKRAKKLNAKKLKNLHLDTIFSKEELHNKQSHFQVVGIPLLSDQYTSVILSAELNSNELSSVLINYTSQYKLIDYKLISFDELSDGITITNSTIYKDSIISKEVNRYDNNESYLKFVISKNGKIKRQ